MHIVDFLSSGDKRLQLGNEEYLRPMPWGSNWSQIRIGLRFAFVAPNGTQATPGSFGILGVCQSSSGGSYLSDLTTDCVGAYIGAQGWTFNNDVACTFLSSNNGLGFLKRGKTSTNTGITGATWFVSANPQVSRSQIFVDITKGSPNFSISFWAYGTSALAKTDTTRTAFLTALSTNSPANMTAELSGGTVAYTGTSALDTVDLAWCRSIPCMEISDLSVVRFF